MKNLRILSTLIIAAVLSTGAFAQENANVAVTAQVEAALSLTPTDVALGTIQISAASILDANASDDATEDNVGDGATAGALAIAGSASTNVIVSWTNATLDDGASGTPVLFTPSVWNTTTEVSSGGTVTLDGSGDATLDIGGELAATDATGAYSTSLGTGSVMVFTVSYE